MLPEQFSERMKNMLGEEYEEFENSDEAMELDGYEEE